MALDRTLLLTVALLAACNGGDEDTDAAAEDRGPPPLGEPIADLPPGEWTYVGFEGATCDDGSETGIGINPGTSGDLLVFFMGGGACWDYTTCYMANFAAHGPFQEADLASYERWLDSDTIFDREAPENPYADWTFVFVPYCTGDIHGGDSVVTYSKSDGSDPREYHHSGHKNVLAYLERLGATYPAPPRVVVTGASAGGGGATLNYDTFRWYWPDAEMMLLNDSLPFFVGDAVQQWMKDTWMQTWNLAPLMDEACPDGSCAYDFSQVHVQLAEKYPDDRMALLSSEQDQTISTYLLMSEERYQEELYVLDGQVLGPTGWKRFFVPGNSHTMVADPYDFEAEGVTLWTWLGQMTNDDPAWESVGP
jgi:hypothetical protein